MSNTTIAPSIGQLVLSGKFATAIGARSIQTYVIDPRGLTVTDWCDSMAMPLGVIMSPQRLSGPDLWQEWARNVVQVPMVAGLNPPNPDRFDDWREWAMRFNQVFQAGF